MEEAPNPTNPDLEKSAPAPHPLPAPATDKKLLIAGAVVAVLLVITIVLLLFVLMRDKKDTGTTATNSDRSQQEQKSTSTPAKTPIKTLEIPGENKLELLIYEPVATSSNVRIDYSIRNKCEGCQEAVWASAYDAGINPRNAYLLDNEGGRKYNVIKDQDNKPLATTSCGEYLKPKETVSCFIAFTKPSPGTIVAIYFGDSFPLVEGISIPQ